MSKVPAVRAGLARIAAILSGCAAMTPTTQVEQAYATHDVTETSVNREALR